MPTDGPVPTDGPSATGGPAPVDGHPPISVVIATCDRPGKLERAVTAVLGQRYPGTVECLVVYDRVAERKLALDVPPGRSLRYLTNARTAGLPGGRNTGCDAAFGDLLAFCDDDDVWAPDKLRRQVDALRAQPDHPAVACGIHLEGPGIDADRPGPARPVLLDDLLADRIMEVHPSTLLVRRSSIEAAGPVDEQIPGGYAEDYEWLLRLAALGPIGVVNAPLVMVEWHGGSFFFGRWATIVDALRYLLHKHPEFARSRRGQARIRGQIAFALASGHRRGEAAREVLRVLRLNPLEKRLLATAPVLLHLLSGDRVLRMAQSRGRGV